MRHITAGQDRRADAMSLVQTVSAMGYLNPHWQCSTPIFKLRLLRTHLLAETRWSQGNMTELVETAWYGNHHKWLRYVKEDLKCQTAYRTLATGANPRTPPP